MTAPRGERAGFRSVTQPTKVQDILSSFLGDERMAEVITAARARMDAREQTERAKPREQGGVFELFRRVNEAAELVMGSETKAEHHQARVESEARESVAQAQGAAQQVKAQMRGLANVLVGEVSQGADPRVVIDSAIGRINDALGSDEGPLAERVIQAAAGFRRASSEASSRGSQLERIKEALPNYEGAPIKRVSHVVTRLSTVEAELANLRTDNKASLEIIEQLKSDLRVMTERAKKAENAVFPAEFNSHVDATADSVAWSAEVERADKSGDVEAVIVDDDGKEVGRMVAVGDPGEFEKLVDSSAVSELSVTLHVDASEASKLIEQAVSAAEPEIRQAVADARREEESNQMYPGVVGTDKIPDDALRAAISGGKA